MVLWQPALDAIYTKVHTDELAARIAERRRQLGDRLVIMGHHYQTDEVIRHADFTGDSLKLSQIAARIAEERPVEHVIFCGVHFMAETADMLTPDRVRVILPDLSAGCSMADMATADETEEAWELLHETIREAHGGRWHGRIVPITYVNSSAAIKAFVGRHGGACCTSSNADRVMAWALAGGERPAEPGEEIKVLFLPDQHLGRNTAAAHGIDTDAATCVYDPRKTARGEGVGGAEPAEIVASTVLLWAGHCSVHKLFRAEHCDQIRAENGALAPGEEPTRIIVHPECAKEVVDRADESGSTGAIIRAIERAPAGSKWAVGTEFHLVNRLRASAAERGVSVRILSDCQCLCTTMYRIDEPHLLWALDGLCGVAPSADAPTAHNVIDVDAETTRGALLALERMLALSGASAAATA